MHHVGRAAARRVASATAFLCSPRPMARALDFHPTETCAISHAAASTADSFPPLFNSQLLRRACTRDASPFAPTAAVLGEPGRKTSSVRSIDTSVKRVLPPPSAVSSPHTHCCAASAHQRALSRLRRDGGAASQRRVASGRSMRALAERRSFFVGPAPAHPHLFFLRPSPSLPSHSVYSSARWSRAARTAAPLRRRRRRALPPPPQRAAYRSRDFVITCTRPPAVGLR